MVFHPSRIKCKTEKIIIRNNEIAAVQNTQFLSVIIDDKLKWKEHLQYIENKILKSIGIIYKIRPYLDKATLKKPILHFCVPISYISCGGMEKCL